MKTSPMRVVKGVPKVRKKMETRELGLELTEILLGAQDLHYGLWDDDLELKVGNAVAAQQRYTDMLLAALPPLSEKIRQCRVLDIGCGTGHMLAQMLGKGYQADGVSPSDVLSRRIKSRLRALPPGSSRLYECYFQDFPDKNCTNQYDVALFSESFQYIRLTNAFDKLEKLLKPGGLVIICDFFKTAADGDGGPGDQSLKGGHELANFYRTLAKYPFDIVSDEDITQKVSPNLELINTILMDKVRPAGLIVGQFIAANYPLGAAFFRLLMRIMHKSRDKIVYKYFSGYRSKEVFERYKSYRLIRLQYYP
jgi:SAM-dependent methyltransferase